MFFGKMMGRSNVLRLRLSRSIINILAKTGVPIATPVEFADTATATPLKRKGLKLDFSQATPNPLKKACGSDASSLSSPSPQP
ncbi:uncharacterized protein LACBIDRAFT_298081 [Laccaria bicolor S238N-H82]|uniref:Predicted protein n=1 Tax=Laccaria bicolor (strain S238N-H82 / ATCC MYA-4686) TaxID=486041 RepID=B0DC69_LACBS|nr:uncharacterized protein LACBIDRAFT_298081 [Laccaria bicolor S238N-H82]EDR07843.1 predicted protein [Laccaria bicolor S238N-H82]|eukprot:XP_001881632.1 predicted protein [Laccaria bicolor S238N-H82]